MPRKPKSPNPFPLSDHAMRAAGIAASKRRCKSKMGCCAIPECDGGPIFRAGFSAGWQACRKAGRAKSKAVK